MAVAGSRLYIGARDVSGENPKPGRMYALDRAIGSPVWDTPILGNPAWTPAVSGNRVFLGSRRRRSRTASSTSARATAASTRST